MTELPGYSPSHTGGSPNTTTPGYNHTVDDANTGYDAASLAAVLVPIVFGIIFCVGVFANLAVIIVNIVTFREQTRGLRITYTFILNLAIADLLFLVFCVPFQATIYSMGGWPFGEFICVFSKVCQQVAMLASIYTLVALSFDRFFAVVYATSAKQIRTGKNVKICLVVIWTFALALGVPAFATKLGVTFQNQLICVTQWFGIYQELIFVCGYVMPLCNIVICYLAVLYSLKVSANNVAVGRASKRKNRQITRIVLLLVVVFALSWLPHHVSLLWLKIGDFPYTRATFALRVIAHCLSYANSCLNPVIYGCVSATFRRSVSRVIANRSGMLRTNMSHFSARISANFSRTSGLSVSGPPKPRSPKLKRCGMFKGGKGGVPCATIPETARQHQENAGEPITMQPRLPSCWMVEEIVVSAI